ncbi:MAG: hypothetical protein JXR10_09580 [Cyclobacteriaceae bacterium]
MKKLLPHIIYIPIIAFLIFFGYIKAGEAEKAHKEVKAQTEFATRNAEDAKRQAELAEQAQAEAQRAVERALDEAEKLKLALEKCK